MAITLALLLLDIRVCLFVAIGSSSSLLLAVAMFLYALEIISFFSSEAHPDVIQSDGVATLEGYQNDLAYLKRKVFLYFRNAMLS